MKFIDLKLYILADRIHHLNKRNRIRFERVLRRLKRRRNHVWSDLIAARDLPQAEPLVQELLEDVGEWRVKLQEFFHAHPGKPDDALQDRLGARLGHLEDRIEKALDKAPAGAISQLDGENLYRLLGAYRSASEAVIAYARAVGGIDWARWREDRKSVV